jgi:hypothetical protein
MRNGEEMGSNGQIEAKIWQFVYLGYVDTQNSAEEPKCSHCEEIIYTKPHSKPYFFIWDMTLLHLLSTSLLEVEVASACFGIWKKVGDTSKKVPLKINTHK